MTIIEIQSTCPECGKEFKPRKKDSKYCSKECRWKNNGGHNKKKESWWTNAKGYVEGRIWVDDFTQIRVKQHRHIIECHLGRSLAANEDVHHINGNKSDNRIENLEVIIHSAHSSKTSKERIPPKGYKMKITEKERARRSDWLKNYQANNAALAVAKGEV